MEDVLPVGTEVSAKFKGAFCEAKISQVKEVTSIKILLREHPYGILTKEPSSFKEGTRFKVNEATEVQVEDRYVKCTIQQVKKVHHYTVVFNDGDIKILKRNNMVLKSGKHFDAEGNLDAMPLTHPESFSQSVRGGRRGRGYRPTAPRTIGGAGPISRNRNFVEEEEEVEDEEDDEPEQEEVEDDDDVGNRRRRRAASAATAAIGELNYAQGPDTQSDESAADSSEEREKAKDRRKKREEDKAGPSSTSHTRAHSEENVEAGPSTSNGVTSARPGRKKQPKKKLPKLFPNLKISPKLDRKLDFIRRSKGFRKVLRRMKEPTTVVSNLLLYYYIQGQKALQKVLSRKSIRYNMRVKRYGKRKKYKRTVLKSTWRLRNILYRHEWRFFMPKIFLKERCKNFKIWRLNRTEDFPRMERALTFTRTAVHREEVRQWTIGTRSLKKWKVVVVFNNPQTARKLIDHFPFLDECSIDDLFNIERDEVRIPKLTKCFKEEQWFLGLLFPQTREVEGIRHKQRLVHDLTKNTWKYHWECDLIPYSWAPTITNLEQVRINISRGPLAYLFKKSWFICESLRNADLEFNTDYVRQVCEFSNRRTGEYPKVTDDIGEECQHAAPGEPVEIEIEGEDDSDTSIRNADEDEKAIFVALLLEFLEVRGDPPEFKVQGYDVDMFYFAHLIKKNGGAKKAAHFRNYWRVFAKKLIPNAVNAEEELQELYTNTLYLYINIAEKLKAGSLAQPRSDRKTVKPGQYSELRKKKVTMEDEPSTSSPVAASSSSTVTPARKGGRGGGRGRKRKTSRGDRADSKSKRERRSGSGKSSRREDSRSRESSMSPTMARSDSEESNDSNDDETASSKFSADGSDKRSKRKTTPKGRKSKTVTPSSGPSRTSRSVSVRRDDPTTSQSAPKKGRPRKNANAPSTSQRTPAKKDLKQKEPKECDMTGFAFANILSHIYATQQLKVRTTDGGWWDATATDETEDYAKDILAVMLREQRDYPGRYSLSNDTFRELYDIYDKMRVRLHYKGWNQRYDEVVEFPKLMVTEEDQKDARRRFLGLEGGDDLLAQTMSLVEMQFTSQSVIMDNGVIRPTLTIAYFAEKADEALNKTEPYVERQPKVPVRRDRHRTLVESDDEKEDSEDDDDDKEEEEEVKKDAVRDLSVKSDSSDDSDEDDKNRPSTSNPVVETKEEPDEENLSDEEDLDNTIVVKPNDSEPDDNIRRESDDSRPSTVEREVRSGSEEPEYPPVPSPPPVPLDRISSSGSSNYPVLSRQASSHSVSVTGAAAGASGPMPSVQTLFSPTNALAHSGPLTLDEVPPAMPHVSSAAKQQRHDNEAEDSERRDSGDIDEEEGEPSPKKPRVLKTPSSGALLPQFSSGALTLDIPKPVESSGPIEAVVPSTNRKGRKKTGTPNIQKPSPSITSSGPLTLSPSKSRPPGASPLGRPKKKSVLEPTPLAAASMASTSSAAEERVEEPVEEAMEVRTSESIATGSISGKESQDGTSGSVTPATDDKEEDVVKEVEKPTPISPVHVPVRGFGGNTRGKRRRGSRYSHLTGRGTPKGGKKKDENGDDNDEEPSTPTSTVTTPQHSFRADSFVAQKKAMAKRMEQDGTLDDFTLLDELSPFDMTLSKVPKEDAALILEERCNELREINMTLKQEVAMLDKRWKKQKSKEAAETAVSSSSSTTSNSK